MPTRSISERLRLVLVLLSLALAALPALAHGGESAGAGFMADYNAELERTADHLISLAEAIPAEHYDWRPAEGIRSVSETLMHVAATNFYLCRDLGTPLPENLPENLESITDKERVVGLLKHSFELVRQGPAKNAGPRLDAQVDIFGRQMSVRRILFLISGHAHEHLGQSIAYARSIGVVPPWSK